MMHESVSPSPGGKLPAAPTTQCNVLLLSPVVAVAVTVRGLPISPCSKWLSIPIVRFANASQLLAGVSVKDNPSAPSSPGIEVSPIDTMAPGASGIIAASFAFRLVPSLNVISGVTATESNPSVSFPGYPPRRTCCRPGRQPPGLCPGCGPCRRSSGSCRHT